MIDALLVWDGTPPTTGAAITASRASTNVLDMLSARDIGIGDDLEFTVQVTTAFATLTALQISYQTSDDNSTFVDIMLSPALAVANLTVGRRVSYVVPVAQLNDPGTPNRYHRLFYTVTGANATAGAVMAWMTGGYDRQLFRPYGPNYNVL